MNSLPGPTLRQADKDIDASNRRWAEMNHSGATSREYSPSIQGLRAVAVLAVCAFHLGLPFSAGGFVGVDVFFVISGYLISRNILNDVEAGRFRFSDFYLRRMRRILPALIFTVGSTFLAGCLWLSAESLRLLAKEATHSLLSISNYEYWREFTDYFGSDANKQILLHFWSLSLEEQFYLIWPAFLLVGTYLRRPFQAVAVASVLSFAAAFWWNVSDPSGAFFLMPFRIFQFGIGAMAVFVGRLWSPSTTASSLMLLFSFLGLAGSIVWLTPMSTYPSLTLLPAICAALVILAPPANRLSIVLVNRPMQFIGAISYSLYLCHWPIIYFVRLLCPALANAWIILLAALLSFGVAAAMYQFIEQPLRRQPSSQRRLHTAASFLILIAVGAIFTQTVYRTGGLGWRITANKQAYTKLYEDAWAACHKMSACVFGDQNGDRRAVLIGDSTSWNYLAGLDEFFKERHIRARTSGASGCPMLYGVTLNSGPPSRIAKCNRQNAAANATFPPTDAFVVISQAWSEYSDDAILFPGVVGQPGNYRKMRAALETTIAALKPTTKVLLIGEPISTSCDRDYGSHTPGPLRQATAATCPEPRSDIMRARSSAINEMLIDVQKSAPRQIVLINPSENFCGNKVCETTENGVLLYSDAIHLTRAGSLHFTKVIASEIEAFLDSAAIDH